MRLVGEAMTKVPHLDRSLWDFPLVSIVVTHFNYSDLVKDALLSVIDQNYEEWECIVVDDQSDPEHFAKLKDIVSEISDPRIRLIQTPSNLRQIGTFFVGLDSTSGEFVCLLDPDDRWAPTFLDEMVRAHLNDTIVTSLVSCDQRLFRNGRCVTGTYRAHSFSQLPQDPPVRIQHRRSSDEEMLYFPRAKAGWHWTTSSALMFRRDGLDLLRPPVPLNVSSADAYLASGLHLLAGTLFVPRALVYRGIHEVNEALTDRVIGTGQSRQRYGVKRNAPFCRRAAIRALFHNGVTHIIPKKRLRAALAANLEEREAALIAQECPELLQYWSPTKQTPPKKSLIEKVLARVRLRK